MLCILIHYLGSPGRSVRAIIKVPARNISYKRCQLPYFLESQNVSRNKHYRSFELLVHKRCYTKANYWILEPHQITNRKELPHSYHFRIRTERRLRLAARLPLRTTFYIAQLRKSQWRSMFYYFYTRSLYFVFTYSHVLRLLFTFYYLSIRFYILTFSYFTQCVLRYSYSYYYVLVFLLYIFPSYCAINSFCLNSV